MPLHDHFHGPMSLELPWDTLHSSWASDLARGLNARWLQRPSRALEHTHAGAGIEIDIAALRREGGEPVGKNGDALAAGPLAVPDAYEVRVFEGPGGWNLVGAIELVSPGNKDREAKCQAFVAKCAAYLHAGVSVVVVDVVTSRRVNFHNRILDHLGIASARLPDDVALYASAYRPVERDGTTELDIWAEACRVGADLPSMPLRLTGDLFVPVELKLAYAETCRSHGAA
jgi:hypothetical protein